MKIQSTDDWCYEVLKICVENNSITAQGVCEKMKIETACHHFDKLAEFSLINRIKNEANTMVITPHGFSTYLSLSSQKQANKQALKATNYAKLALWISILSFIASIVFSIFQLVTKN